MVQGLLMELKDYNCWSIAEAAGHSGPHRLQLTSARNPSSQQQASRRTAQLPIGAE
jgi:hypothetical protein